MKVNSSNRAFAAHVTSANASGSLPTRQKVNEILIVGNPNVGKSVIFGHLTKKYVTVSNYPGTTVEVVWGNFRWGKNETRVIDTPGVNSLVPMSEDEKVTRDILLSEKPKTVIQVVDAKNLRRGLFITLQLQEMGLPLVLALNMMDEAESLGIFVDTKLLSEILGVEVISTVATRKKGIDKLIKSLEKPQKGNYQVKYDEHIHWGVKELCSLLPTDGISQESLALMILSGDESLNPWLFSHLSSEKISRLERIRQKVAERYSQPLSLMINQMRQKEADKIASRVLSAPKSFKKSWESKLGNLTMHPIWGIPVLLLVLLALYQIVGVWGAGAGVDFLENVVFGEFINPGATYIFNLIPIKFIQELFVGPYGIISMALTYAIAIILPIVGAFFLFFGILEDTGYLPRLAVMVNKGFKIIGLNGKAVLPMVLGLGCDTMATLTTRILGSKKEKIIVTLLLALAVPCSAQLGVILSMLSGLSFYAVILWAGVVISVLFLVGYLSSLVIPGKGSDFILEIPPIRVPQLSNLALKTLARIEWYLKEAVPLFILGTLILFITDKLGILIWVEKVASPLVVNLLNLPRETTQAFIVGFLRRDYGAAGLFVLAKEGRLDAIQIVVSLVTITLFVPCLANFLIVIKERGWKTALAMIGFIFPFAFAIGALLNFLLRLWRVSL